MKKIFTLFLLIGLQAVAQQPYYNNVDITLTGQNLYLALQQKIDVASNSYTYGDNRGTMPFTDENPDATSTVLLLYGYNDTDNDCVNDRSRLKTNFGGGTCEYNREHTFVRSNSNPSMGDANNGATGIVADPHNIRPSDVTTNGNRGSRKFADGSGNAGVVTGGNWYPGDEWKGDVARMMMYMYTRYGDRCLPTLNGFGAKQGSTEMLQVYLQWNVDDPVNAFEDQRNPYLETVYGNRNPFVDNPYLATVIWGGPAAEDRWGVVLATNDIVAKTVSVYPNPTSGVVYVQSTSAFSPVKYEIYDALGRTVLNSKITDSNKGIDVSALKSGMYILKLVSSETSVIKSILVK